MSRSNYERPAHKHYGYDDPLSEAAFARAPIAVARRDCDRDRPPTPERVKTPYHGMLVAACRKRGLYFEMARDGSVKVTEMGNPKMILGVFDTPKEAIAFVDRLPIIKL